MTRADFFGGLLLSAFFGAALWEGWTFQYGTEFAPGPGFAPVWLSVIGLCVSLLIAAHGLRAVRGGERPSRRRLRWRRGASCAWRSTLLGMAAMVFLVQWLGLVVSMLLFLLYSHPVRAATRRRRRHRRELGHGRFRLPRIRLFPGRAVPKGPLGF